MSHPHFHSLLQTLLEERNPEVLNHCFLHPDFETFKKTHYLTIPKEELVKAFIHTSFSHEYQIPHQEQLEFLGDSVLQLILTDELYHRFPDEKEGSLSKRRSSLVNESSLAKIARSIKLDQLILVGKGEFKRKLFEQDATIADTFEALLAQVYRFQGLEFARLWVLALFKAYRSDAFDMNALEQFDAKSKLQEASLGKYKKLPLYTSLPVEGGFEVKLWVNDILLGSGIYPSKKTGEKELASLALKQNLI